jgi:hypothetical protein
MVITQGNAPASGVLDFKKLRVVIVAFEDELAEITTGNERGIVALEPSTVGLKQAAIGRGIRMGFSSRCGS